MTLFVYLKFGQVSQSSAKCKAKPRRTH